MSNRIVAIHGGLILLLTVSATAGCGDPEQSSPNLAATYVGAADFRAQSQETGEQDVLRVREDPVRNRLWVLTLKEVRIYNTAITGKRLIRKITLPAWSAVGFRNVCMPDMVLDRAGSAFISRNGQARLLRIDADRLALEDYAISFQGREGLDIGVGALAFAADGTLLARTIPDGLLWKIDIAKAKAMMTEVIKKLPVDQCAITTRSITTQLLGDFEKG